MAALQPTTLASVAGQITITGATSTGSLIFDATINSTFGGHSEAWILDIANVDADAGDDFYIGFSATQATVALGFPVGVRADTTTGHAIRLFVPAHQKVYANCTNAETRDLRMLATPYLGT